MNGYVFFYNNQRLELRAESLHEAALKAAEHFKPPKSKRHMVHGVLAELAGAPVVHVADI